MLVRRSLALCLVFACSSREPKHPAESPESPIGDPAPLGIDGCNCAGAPPALLGPDGNAYPFQSVVAYYYKVLEAFLTFVDGQDVLETWLPPEIEAMSEEFITWQAKSIQVLQDEGQIGFSDRYYDGMFGFLGTGISSTTPLPPNTCGSVLNDALRLVAMLAHVGLSQKGQCGENSNKTKKYWQVNNISLLLIGMVYDALELVRAGLAAEVTQARASRCILQPALLVPASTMPTSISADLEYDPIIPCRIAFRDDAVTEAVVLPVPSSAVVSNVAVGHRPFSAAGYVPMPNGLDQARNVLRGREMRVMAAVGVPRFAPEPQMGPTHVRLVGHHIGPVRDPSPLLFPDERAWVDSHVGLYEPSCCRVECTDGGSGYVARVGYGDFPTDDAGVYEGSGADAGIVVDDGGVGSGSDAGIPPTCTTTCIPEGVCQTSSATTGLAVMVAAVTFPECDGDCPQPTLFPPASAPSNTCAP